MRFTLKRVKGGLRTVAKNRMALIGIFLLVVFIFLALAAPILSPYNPKTQVSGKYAAPDWLTNFPDGYYLSKNLADPSSPTVMSPASLQGWSVTASPAAQANLRVSYVPGVSLLRDSKGSLQLAYSGDSPANVTISETFNFPYHGPPYEFHARLGYLLQGASDTAPIAAKLFITRWQQPSPQTFLLTNASETISGTWLPTATDLKYPTGTSVTIPATPDQFTIPQFIFSEATTYSYGLAFTFTGHQSVNIDNLQLQLLGTAWGTLGTDYAGFDVFTQTIYGSRISLLVGLLAAGIGIGLGLVVGLLAGFLGKFVDEVLMRFTDMMLVIPALPLLIVLVAVLGTSIVNLIIVIGFLGWMGFARVIRSQVLTIRERPFVEAARASGAGSGRIIVKHVFPNIVSLTYVNLALSVPAAILTEAALAFLGLSDPTVVSWGNMFYQVEANGATARFPPVWWWVLPPGLSIALVSLSFILIGYALDDIFNPRLRRRR
jgi:ABC-type dipeptide/oligopeptide/nickel transport system permease subunit